MTLFEFKTFFDLYSDLYQSMCIIRKDIIYTQQMT